MSFTFNVEPFETLGQGIDKIDRNHHPMCRRIEKAWHEL